MKTYAKLAGINTRFHIIAALFLLLLVVASYRGITECKFTYFDDDRYVWANPQVEAGITAASLRWAFTTYQCSNWHPLTWVSHMFDCQLFGSDAAAHHIVNVALHAANCILLYALLVMLTNAVWPSLFVAVIFAIHPLNVESVAWISERKNVLSTTFLLLTIIAYSRYCALPSKWRYLTVFILYTLGLLAKPMLVSLPIVLLLLDYWPLRSLRPKASWKNLIIEKLPLLAPTAASCIITVIAQRHGEAVAPFDSIPAGVRLANAAAAGGGYLEKLFWPVGLAAYYPHPKTTLPEWLVVANVVLLAMLTAAAILAAKKRPYVAVGWFWFLITMVPVVGLVQVGMQAMADRYMYVPMIGLLVAIAWLVWDLVRERPVARLVAAVVSICALAAMIPVTTIQVGYWKSDITLFDHCIAVTRPNALAHFNVGCAYERAGDRATAMRHYIAAVTINPKHAKAHYNLAVLYSWRGENEKAIGHYRRVLRLNPDDVCAANNLGHILMHRGQLQEAIKLLERAARLAPNEQAIQRNLRTAKELQKIEQMEQKR